MSYKAVKVIREEWLLVCDWCGKEQTSKDNPIIDKIEYVREYEGNHGHMRDSIEQIHICRGGRCKQELHEMIRSRNK